MLLKEDMERVRILRLANPPANVLNLTFLETLRKEVAAAAAEEGVRCLVLASSYPRYFSTGLDLEEMASLPPERRAQPFLSLLETYRALRDLPKPSLAAIGGSALLGGWILAMACDFRLLARESGRISLSEIRLGLSPTSALIARLREISCSPSLVKEMILRGRTLRAEEALSGGFVDRLVSAESLQEEALREARQLARQPLGAYAAIKRSLRGAGEEALWRQSREEFKAFFGKPEPEEGIAAMREKRRPRWEA